MSNAIRCFVYGLQAGAASTELIAEAHHCQYLTWWRTWVPLKKKCWPLMNAAFPVDRMACN